MLKQGGGAIVNVASISAYIGQEMDGASTYLYNVTKYRRTELPSIARILAYAGPIVFAVCAIWYQYRQGHAADVFTQGAVKTKKHAEDVLRNNTNLVAGLSLAASIASGFATIMISLNAMRAGIRQ